MSGRAPGRWIAALASLCAALALTAGFLGWKLLQEPEQLDLQAALSDPEIRRSVVAELMSNTEAIFDSHPDPDVGRILQPRMTEREFGGHPVRTNARGIREKEWATPKPPGTTRIVFVGDSFVMGHGAAADDRMGAVLEEWIRARVPDVGPVECLHLGVSSWDIVAQCQYVRRQMGDLQPDLVVQLLIKNDLDDNAGVRGFGAMSSFGPRVRSRADARVTVNHAADIVGSALMNLLLDGIDGESRSRYERLILEVTRLRAAALAYGGHYLLAVNWPHAQFKLHPFLEAGLPEDAYFYVPDELKEGSEYRVSASNHHWNRLGNEYFGGLIYHLVRERDLLGPLELPAWPEVEDPARARVAAGRAQATNRPANAGRYRLASELVVERLKQRPLDWRQVYTGLDGEGRVSPFLSIVLGRGDARRVRLQGRAFERAELVGASVTVFAEEFELGSVELVPGDPVVAEFELPEALLQRGYVNVRLACDDWVYAGAELRHCVSFALEEIALVE